MASPYKVMPFTLLPALNSEWELNIFFIIGLISAFFLIVGYKTRFFQLITTVVVLSIHNKVTAIENGGDMVINNYLIWSLFLPLGAVWSIDSIIKKLNEYYEKCPSELNFNQNKKSYKVFSFAFFVCLIQLCMIYFFNHTNKTGNDWKNSLALHYFFELDTFLTPIGYFIKDIITDSLLKYLSNIYFITIATVPLFFFPFFTNWIRLFYFIFFISFHSSVALFVSIGVFSYIMMTADIFLLGSPIIEFFRNIGNKITGKPLNVYYLSENIKVHRFARLISRLDVFNKINWDELNQIDNSNKDIFITASNQKNENQLKRNGNAIYQISKKIPFGIIIGWLFLIPGINWLITNFWKLNSKTPYNHNQIIAVSDNSQNTILRYINSFKTIITVTILFCLLFSNVHRAIIVNEPTKSRYDFREYRFNRKLLNYLRMKQNWKMFAPNVLKNENILIVDLITENNVHIDPFTGQKPINKNIVNFQKQDVNYGQFIRKFMKRSTKNDNSAKLNQLEKWLIQSIQDINGKEYSKTKSFKIWKISEHSPRPNSKPTKIRKKLLSEYHVDSGIINKFDKKYKGRRRYVTKHK